MRFLANENLPLVAVEALRRSGHDTAWVQPMAPDDLARWVVSSLEVRTDWKGHFAVVEAGRVRLRRLSPKRHR
jgi:hypothetical protein